VGLISNDFGASDFEREEEEEDRINDLVSSDSKDEQGGIDSMPTLVPIQELHAMPAQGRLERDMP